MEYSDTMKMLKSKPVYLGETCVKQKDTPFNGYFPADWALKFVYFYGGVDGDHHKTWVLDQVARILNGTPVIMSIAKWDDGQEEYRFETGKPSQKYFDWVTELRDGEDGPETYSYDVGIAP